MLCYLNQARLRLLILLALSETLHGIPLFSCLRGDVPEKLGLIDARESVNLASEAIAVALGRVLFRHYLFLDIRSI